MKGYIFPIQHLTEMTGFFAFLQLYVLAARVTFICAMSFDAFPLDIQTCLLQVQYSLIYKYYSHTGMHKAKINAYKYAHTHFRYQCMKIYIIVHHMCVHSNNKYILNMFIHTSDINV